MATIKVLNYSVNDHFYAGNELADYQVVTGGGSPTRGDIFRFAKVGNQFGILTTEYGGQKTSSGKEFAFWPKSEVGLLPDEEGKTTDFEILLENSLSSADGWRVFGKI
jgi:hypothetical protein